MTDLLLERFGVCTDEVHDDLEMALQVARQLGMRQVELLECWGKPVVELNEAELSRLQHLLERYELSVSAIGSLFLKLVRLGHVPTGNVADDAHFRRDLALFHGSLRVARRLGAPLVRTYAFRRDDMIDLGNPSPQLPGGGVIPELLLERIVEGLRLAADETAAADLLLGLENVRSCWANTGLNTARVIRAVAHPALRAIWDPGNDYVASPGSFVAGYTAVRPFISHIHVKDARLVDAASGLTAWEAVGAGEVDYVGQFAALRHDGYTGTLSLETHWHPSPPGGQPDRIRDSRLSFAGVRQALAASLTPAGSG